jgi:flagellar biosynthetic protein FlhB
MANSSASDKTEEATPERLRKARQEGQITQSNEVPSALIMVVILVALSLMGPSMLATFKNLCSQAFQASSAGMRETEGLSSMLHTRAMDCLMLLLPFMITMALASIFGSVMVGGWCIAPKAINIKLSRISFGQGFKGLFSAKSIVVVVLSFVKLALIAALVWPYIQDKMGLCLSLRWQEPPAIIAAISQVAFGIMIRITAGLAGIAGADWLYQRWKYKRDMRMTKQEVKEERRQQEQAPEVRNRIRTIRMTMFRRRMLKRVKQADVVIVNPTHVAVALKYDAKISAAPTVVAKGAELVCAKIKEIAQASNVPIVHRPELARAIFHTVEVDKPIPQALYVAVAEVLAMIYRMRKRQPARSN